MAFAKKTWKDRIAEFPTRRRLTKEDNTSELVTVAREEGTLSQEGDAFSAENMNDLENRIDAEFTAVNGNLEWKTLQNVTGTTAITLPIDYTELMLKVTVSYNKNNLNMMLYVAKNALSSTAEFYPCTNKNVYINKYYSTNAMLLISTQTVQLEAAHVAYGVSNFSNVTSSSKLSAYYR